MAPSADLPCDGDGACMVCKLTPPEPEVMTCRTCVTPWHVSCLSAKPETLALTLDWQCPDCSPPAPATTDACTAAAPAASSGLVASIRAIEADASLTEQEKARRRQELLSSGPAALEEDGKEKGKKTKGKGKGNDDVLDLLDESFSCCFCMQLPDRPVTTPCGHNFCLKCFQKWAGQGKHTCAKCRAPIPQKMYSQPRINSSLVAAIRLARAAKSPSNGTPSVSHFIRNENRPDKAFTTERAKKTGKANACSGQIFVTVPPDHFGPILAQHDPKRSTGVLVGELWEDRMECRQWGIHLPHVAGIAGQSDYGAQSVALSGGYADDEDHGEWFLYTGSGGRDLSGNKRTNKDQSFDQKFEKYNEALRLSCKKGYPVRVVRSHKEKRSSYAPETGVRYDGIFRIEKCWRKVGIQGFKVCRYLFVRCDNEPAPWTSDVVGDRPRPLPDIKELKNATDITVRKETPAWDYDEENGWKWMKPPPPSRKMLYSEDSQGRKRARKTGGQNLSVSEQLLKEFSCQICRKVMTGPLTTPCDHNFCKSCLLESYADQSFMRERTREGGRTLRAQKIVKKCPACPNDISEFLQNPQVNRELMDVIESLQQKAKEENVVSGEEESDVLQKSGEDASESVDDEMSEGHNKDVKTKIHDSNGGMEMKSADSKIEEEHNADSKIEEDIKTSEKNPEKRAGKRARKNDDVSKASTKGVAKNAEGNSVGGGRVTRSGATPEGKKTRNSNKVESSREVARVSQRRKLLMQADDGDDDDDFQ